jgi:hypothetical protein
MLSDGQRAAGQRGSGASCCESPGPSGWPESPSFPFSFTYPYTTTPSRTWVPRSIIRVSIATIRTRSSFRILVYGNVYRFAVNAYGLPANSVIELTSDFSDFHL